MASMMDMPRHHGPFMKRADFPMHYGLLIERHHVLFHPTLFGGWMIWKLFSFLFQLSMIIVGWIIWKTARRSSGWKWIGLALAAAGGVALLPKILLVPLILVAAYMVYKKRQSTNGVLSEEFAAFVPMPLQTEDFLDRWEEQMKKEEP